MQMTTNNSKFIKKLKHLCKSVKFAEKVKNKKSEV